MLFLRRMALTPEQPAWLPHRQPMWRQLGSRLQRRAVWPGQMVLFLCQ
jgi:hypothetical protein